MYPKSKKIELFSREKNKNWDSIGSDINFSIEEFLNLYK
jgi:N6-adenosine-specific RNA methylase IME4